MSELKEQLNDSENRFLDLFRNSAKEEICRVRGISIIAD